jgi:hypothetical protein
MTCLQLLRRLALLLILAPATCGAWQGGDLTGTWSDDAGGRYRIRQSGNTLVWFDDRGPVVMNVFTGTINGSSIEGQWWDVPGGQLLGSGRIWLSIESSDRIVKTNSSPDYGGTVITRVGGRADAGGPGVCTPVGKWDWVDGAKTVIHADGSVTHTSGYAARWQPLGGSRFLLTWNNGAIDTLTLSADGRAMTGSNNHGRSIRVTCDGPVPTADPANGGACTPVGKWDWVDGARAVIHADGSVTHSSGYAARWQPLGGSRYLLTWNNGAIDTLTLSADGRTMTGATIRAARSNSPVPRARPLAEAPATPPVYAPIRVPRR